MCMNYSSTVGKSLVKFNVCRCIAGRFVLSLNYIAIKINNNHILCLHPIIRNPGRFDDKQTSMPILLLRMIMMFYPRISGLKLPPGPGSWASWLEMASVSK